jgi:hypothetical protein
MDCERRIGNRCKDKKHFNEACGRLRPFICETRKKIEQGRAEKVRLVQENPDYPEMGMGA